MTPFELTAILMTLVALVGWLNVKALHLPHGVVMLLLGIAVALALFALRASQFGAALVAEIVSTVSRIDFVTTVVGIMLPFLLFAGAMQVDLGEMRRRWAAIALIATLGVAGSVIIVGVGAWAIARALHIDLPLPWALVFGALISPTDPVAVLATVKHGKLSKTMEIVLQGEALFNDGVGIVVFTALIAFATGIGDAEPGGDRGTPITALRGETLVAQYVRHQRREAICHRLDTEAGLPRAERQTIARERRGYDGKRIRGITAEACRIGQPWDNVQELEHRARPAVR